MRIALIAAVFTRTAAAAFATPPPTRVQIEDNEEARALKWFAPMQAAQSDRTQLTAAAYSTQLTDAAVQGMSRYLAGEREAMSKFSEADWEVIVAATHTGMATGAFLMIAKQRLTTAKDPRFGRHYTELV